MRPGIKSAGRVTLEVASIAFAVMLGFGVTEWGESRREHERGRHALAAIQREMASNRASVSEAATYYGTFVQALTEAIASGGDGPVSARRVEGWRGLSPPLIRSASFELAVSTGALEHVDFDVADRISRTYEVQSHLTFAIDQALAAMVAGRLIDLSDWLRVTALLSELTVQTRGALGGALDALDGGSP